MRITCDIGDGRKFIVLEEPLQMLISHRQLNKQSKEAGGLLIGRHLLGNENIVVDYITEPMRWDKRLFAYFYRSVSHNRLLHRIWSSSNRTQTLIGLWHTHPESYPNPSNVDFMDWNNILLKGDFVGDFLFFIIVGTRKIGILQGNRNKQLTELSSFSIPK